MMIDKLRRRVAMVLMLVFLALIVGVMGCIMIVSARQSVERQKEFRRSATISPLSRRTERTAKPYRADTPSFTVRITPSGRVDVFMRSFAISDEEAKNAANEALESGSTSGLLRNSELRYLIRIDAEGSKRIAFLSTAEYAEQLRTQVMTFLLMTPVLLGLLFFLAALPLSKWLTKPVRQAWDAQKQFIADASHELKTPLTVILANLSILRRQYPDEKWLESTHEEAQRMRRLVEEMLTLARTENERHALTLSQTNLSELLEHTLMTMEPVAFERGVTLQTHIAQNVTVPCSELHARRLMMILLDNAVKYAEGEKKVTVTLTGKQDPCELRVSNTGAPIPPEILPHVFDRFYRGDTTRAGGGFGLGLVIAKETVEALRGSIGVTSSESDGTTFTVLLRGKGSR